MTIDILISVVIPTYNRKEKLTRCLNSVAENDLNKCEVIVVDDGSNDGTVEMLKKEYSWIILICQENYGVSCARNQGAKIARGQFIAFLDSDDIWHKDRITIVKNIIKKLPDNIAIVFNDMDSIVKQNGNGISYSDYYFGKSKLPVLQAMKKKIKVASSKGIFEVRFGYIYKQLIHGNIIQPSCMLLRRRVFRKEGGFREDFRVANDSEYFLRLAKQCHVAYIPLILTSLEPPMLSDSLSNPQNSIEKISNMLIAIEEHITETEQDNIMESLLERRSELKGLLAYHYLSDLNLIKARKYYREAQIMPHKYRLKYHLMWLVTWLPKPFFKIGKDFKQFLKRFL